MSDVDDGEEVVSHSLYYKFQGRSLPWKVRYCPNIIGDALENLNTQENITKDSNRYFSEKVWKILNFISQI